MLKTKVLLIDPPEFSEQKQEKKSTPNIGLAYLSSVLKDNDIENKFLDSFAINENEIEGEIKKIENEIKNFKPSVVALTAKTFNIISAVKILTIAKKTDSKIVTILGGSHISALPERTLEEFNDIDFGVIGEGEETLIDLIREIYKTKPNYKKVKGIVFRKEKKIIITEKRQPIKDINKIPFPNWENINFDNYKKFFSNKLNGYFFRFPICFSRGCPSSCTFCSNLNKIWRHRNPKLVVDEIEYNYNRMNARLFEIIDSTSTVNKEAFHDFCNELIKRGLHKKISWTCETRVNYVDKKMLLKMKAAGCEGVYYGIESGDEEILKIMKKGITKEQIKRAIKLTKDAGLIAGGSFIFGHPYEKEGNILNTINFSVELAKVGLKGVNFFILDIYPGSEVWNMVSKNEGGSRWLKGKKYNWKSYHRFEAQISIDGLSQKRLLKLRDYAQYRFENATYEKRLKSKMIKILYRNDRLKLTVRKIKNMI